VNYEKNKKEHRVYNNITITPILIRPTSQLSQFCYYKYSIMHIVVVW